MHMHIEKKTKLFMFLCVLLPDDNVIYYAPYVTWYNIWSQVHTQSIYIIILYM